MNHDQSITACVFAVIGLGILHASRPIHAASEPVIYRWTDRDRKALVQYSDQPPRRC